ncbi:MAG TPA: hypothetical protein VEO54_12095 [Thermoanaerobaculia bacterium]|nr:hypothetical protein [Thermoanaerobaculia bacterium]
MTIKRSLLSLHDALETLARMVREVTVAVDDAGENDLAVLDALRGHAAELEGELAETAAALQPAIAAGQRGDAAAAACALAGTHERFTALGRRLRFGLAGHDTLFAIVRLPSRRGATWRGWSEVVLRQLQQVDDALYDADAAFVASWQEIADVALHAPTHRKETAHA